MPSPRAHCEKRKQDHGNIWSNGDNSIRVDTLIHVMYRKAKQLDTQKCNIGADAGLKQETEPMRTPSIDSGH